MNINDACDYIIVKLTEGGVFLNVLKLQKLLYYCQAWNLAFNRGPLFNTNFQAWVHGPVNRTIYDRFQPHKALYSAVGPADVRQAFNMSAIDGSDRAVMDSVLEVYAPLTGDQLEEMTHREDPWIEARKGLPASARCENVISNDTMQKFYGARLEAKPA